MLIALSLLAMGAKGGGCSAEYAPGDGSSAEWETGPIPEPSAEILPMTCEWLESNNCWKELIASADGCRAAVTAPGEMNDERDGCDYEGGAAWEFGGALSTPAAASTQFPVTNWRIVDDSGEACMTGKVLGIGRSIIDANGSVALLESPTLTTYHLTCADGTTYGNDQPGTCESFAERWLLQQTPGVLFTCDGSAERCELAIWGSASEETVTSCDF